MLGGFNRLKARTDAGENVDLPVNNLYLFLFILGKESERYFFLKWNIPILYQPK
jgi:hypothetical protein